jgi:hypothetical protein
VVLPKSAAKEARYGIAREALCSPWFSSTTVSTLVILLGVRLAVPAVD